MRSPKSHSRRLFDIVIRRKGNADGGVLACRLSQERAGDETLTVLRFHKPIGVLRALLSEELRRFMFVGNSSKRSDPLDDSIQGHVRIESQLKSLILAQNERWRQA
jgi:hypothetical protein